MNLPLTYGREVPSIVHPIESQIGGPRKVSLTCHAWPAPWTRDETIIIIIIIMTPIPASSPPTTTTSKRVAKPQSPRGPETTTTFPIRNLTYTYLHLCLTYPEPAPSLTTAAAATANTAPSERVDMLTAHVALQSALSRFLGLHGAAIPTDILHLVPGTGRFWIRVPREDGDRVVAATAGWVGREGQVLRVEGRGDWLGGVVMMMRGKEVWK